MKGKRVCFIHGGKSPGAPTGNRNAFKTGLQTAEAKADRKFFRQLFKSTQELIASI
jgi:hypothetical protein